MHRSTSACVGSRSAIKSTAVRTGCAGLIAIAPFEEVAADSGVNTQPVGHEEILRGARNRASTARVAAPGSWAFGIENGIVFEDGRWQDLAAVVVIAPDGSETVEWSESVTFPEDLVERARAIGFDQVTVGSLIAKEFGCRADDPHSYLTGGKRSRLAFLTDAVAAAMRRALRVSHRVTVGGVVRDLPIREVKRGVSVALFNIMGDWVLAEAAGKALAPKIRRLGDVALLMPEGKAIALLHVVGRETGLPTFVARKEKKPYMAEPLVSATYRSVTTNREQSLFLDANDAHALSKKDVVILDDVVSTGGTVEATKLLLAEIGSHLVGIAAIFTEGGERWDVISLGNLPLF